MRNNIRIYEIKTEYIKYLCQYQKHLFMHDNGEEKHKKMAERCGFYQGKRLCGNKY